MIHKKINLSIFLIFFFFLNIGSGQNPGDDFIPFIQNGKWGYFDQSNNIEIQPAFDKAGLFQNGLASVTVNGKDGLINSIGKFVLEPIYSTLDKYKDDPCANPLVRDAISEGYKIRSYFKNRSYTIIKSWKGGSLSSNQLASNEEYKIFNFDGTPIDIGKITSLKLNPYSEHTAVITNLLFKSDSIYYFWDELDSIYKLGAYTDVDWTLHSNYFKATKDNSEFILNKRGKIVLETAHHKLWFENNLDKIIIKAWNKDELKKYLIEDKQLKLIGTYPSDYNRYPPQFGYEAVTSNRISKLYSESGEKIRNSESDDPILYNERYMIVTKKDRKMVFEIRTGQRINNLSFCSAHFAKEDLIIASISSCEVGTYIDGHILINGVVKNWGVYYVNGEKIIDSIYDSIIYNSEESCFICIKKDAKFRFDIFGRMLD